MVDVLGFFRGKREAAKPKAMQGASGFVVTGGYIQSNEINTKLQGQTRWKTASDLLTNISIIAAGVRYSLNLIARPEWSFEPAIKDSAEAREMAEFAQSVLEDIEGTWTAVVRRMALYRWHGFGLHEWQAVERGEDGRIGIGKIAVRPCHTVERWDIEPDGTIKGVWQKRPIDGKEIYLPRAKTLYLVDDSLTDNPEGMGWFRHLVEPASRLRRLLEIETMGFERDLNGIPVGRAPIAEINAMVGTVPQGWTKTFTQEDANAAIAGITSFVRMEAKKPGTGVLLDSQPYASQSADGESLTGEKMWDIDLLTSDPNGLDSIAKAVERLEYEMSLVMGTDSMLTGRGGEGSRALSQDKSHNLYLLAESTIGDIKEVVDRDLIGPLWAMNGLDEALKPKAKTESINFKDAAHIAQVLKDMATAGAVLAPDDPAIDDLRSLLDLPPQPALTDEERGILMGTKPSADAQLGQEGKDKDREAAASEEEPPGGPPNPPRGQSAARKAFDPNQPRDPAGTETGGQWTSTGVPGERYDGSPNAYIQGENAEFAAELDESFSAKLSLTDDEMATVKQYSGSDGAAINKTLRRDDGFINDLTVKHLDRAIAKERLVTDLYVYRGLGALDTEAEELPIGSIISDKGFGSTTASPNVGAKFASWADERQDEPILLRIKAPKGSNALHLHPGRSHLPLEHEVLFPRGQRMRVLSKPTKEKIRVYREDREVSVIDLELVP